MKSKLKDIIQGDDEKADLRKFRRCSNKGESIYPCNIEETLDNIEGYSDKTLKGIYEASLRGVKTCNDKGKIKDSQTYDNIADYIHNLRALLAKSKK